MALTYQEIYDMIEELLPDNTSQEISEEDLRDVCHAILDRTNESDIASLGIEWSGATTYAEDDLVTSLNRIWKSKADDNLNHQPPVDPDVTEDTWWIEQSKSESSPIKEWSAGVFGAGLIIVYYKKEFYLLTEGIRPFNSSDLATETTDGKWEKIINKTISVDLNTPSSDKVVTEAALSSFSRVLELDLSDFGSPYSVGETGSFNVKIEVEKSGSNIKFKITNNLAGLSLNVSSALTIDETADLTEEDLAYLVNGTHNWANGHVPITNTQSIEPSFGGTDNFYAHFRFHDANNSDAVIFNLLIDGTKLLADPDLTTSYQPFYTGFEDNYLFARYYPEMDLKSGYRDLVINLENADKQYIDFKNPEGLATRYDLMLIQDLTGGHEIGYGLTVDITTTAGSGSGDITDIVLKATSDKKLREI